MSVGLATDGWYGGSVGIATDGYYGEESDSGGVFLPFPRIVPVLPPELGILARVVMLEVGASVTFSWATAIHKSLSGKETREATLNSPRQRYEGAAYLLAGDTRDMRAQLAKHAAAGDPFLLGLSYEEITASGDGVLNGPDTIIPVASTGFLDWAQVETQVVIVRADGEATYTTITEADSFALHVAGDQRSVAVEGCRIIPLMTIYLDPQQAFSRWPVTAEQWQVRAMAASFGWGTAAVMGAGAFVNSYASRPIFDRGIVADDVIADSVQSMAEILDFGAVPLGVGSATTPDWGRRIVFRSSDVDDWQWFKAFIATVRGANRAFWLPSYREDLEVVSNAGDELTVLDVSHEGAGDPLVWYPDLRQHVELMKADDSIQRVQLTAVHDNLDGTLTFQASTTITGTVVAAAWIDLCRLEKDDVTVTWHGDGFTVAIDARAVIR